MPSRFYLARGERVALPVAARNDLIAVRARRLRSEIVAMSELAEEAGAKWIELQPALPVIADFRVLRNAEQSVSLEAHGFRAVPFQEDFGAVAD